MSEDSAIDGILDSGFFCVFTDHHPKSHSAHAGAVASGKKTGIGFIEQPLLPGTLQVFLQGFHSFVRHRHHPFTFPPHFEKTHVEKEVLDIQIQKFLDLQPAGIEQFQDRTVSKAEIMRRIGRLQQFDHFICRKGLWSIRDHFRVTHTVDRIGPDFPAQFKIVQKKL